ncbi:E3 ubiquitin-protein ligase ORTHRUS 5 [Termitomyces sp. J132]|nr:E3 ubiquitin-protein ligase ORTHRUS 5 [Termitomyces sp. J132]
MAAERMRAMLMQNKDMYPTNIPPPTDPRFGNLGVPVGKIYENRQSNSLLGHKIYTKCVHRKELAESGLHTKTYAGISGSVALGAFSIVVSGTYADDNDQGDFLVYTGTGGQQDPFSSHSAIVADQSFLHNDNRALQRSAETKRPVRVIRGSGAGSYAPSSGYRFDGMYVVEDAYMDKGIDGFAVCKYNLRRVAGQPPIPKSWSIPSTQNVRRKPTQTY